MSAIKLASDSLIVTPAGGNIEYNGQFFATDSNNARAQLGRLVVETAQASTSGTSIDFTGIPAWAKRITVMVTGVSSSGSSNFQIQLGTSSGIVSTGYVCGWTFFGTSTVTINTATTGFVFTNNGASETTNTLINICNVNSNNWMTSFSNSTSTGRGSITGGNISLPSTLDRVRITTVNGTDTFDAGTINILYEG